MINVLLHSDRKTKFFIIFDFVLIFSILLFLLLDFSLRYIFLNRVLAYWVCEKESTVWVVN